MKFILKFVILVSFFRLCKSLNISEKFFYNYGRTKDDALKIVSENECSRSEICIET